MSSPLVDADELRRYLRLDSGGDAALLASLAEAATDAVERHCRRRFGRAAETETFGGRGTSAVFLSRRPVWSVEAVWDDAHGVFADATRLPASRYAVESATGILRLRHGVFGHGAANVRVVYNGGFDPIPPAVKQAAMILAAHYHHHARQGADGVAAETLGGYSVQYDHADWPPHVLALLADFKTVDF